jgi:hypothetical protein
MEPELPPMSEELQKLVRPEQGFPPLPPGMEAKLWAGIASQMPAALSHAAASAPHAAHGVSPLGRALLAKWPLGVAFAVGAGAGAGVHATYAKPAVIVQTVEREPAEAPAPPPTPVAPAAAVPVEPIHHRPMKVPSTPASVKLTPPPPPAPLAEDPSLAAERSLIEMGRTALSRGKNQDAYRTMLEHEKQFPNGKLAEERDVVRIQELVAMGQLEAARVLAQSFYVEHPNSLLRPAVEQALKAVGQRP